MGNHEFVHLHSHSYFSFLDGVQSPDEMCAKAKDLGCNFIGLSDHGRCCGHYDFIEAAKKYGLTPLTGTELYLRDENYHRTPKRGIHLTIFPVNLNGLHEVWDISSRSWERPDGKDEYTNAYWEDLGERREGVICGSACLGGPISRCAKENDEAGALEFVKKFQSIFDEFFIEIHTNSEPEQRKVNMWLMDFAKKHDIRTVYAVDAHYVDQQDSELQNAMIGAAQRKRYDDPDRMVMKADYYMMDEVEVRKRLAYLGEEDIERCFDGMDYLMSLVEPYELDKSHKIPDFPLPEGWDDPGEYLRFLTIKGLMTKVAGCEITSGDSKDIKYKGGDISKIKPYMKQLIEEEFPVIIGNNLSNYFLIVSDYTRYAKTRMFVGHGRGSAAASILCYATDITEVDPLGKDLIFSRFLNETRAKHSVPDIDLDFPTATRHEVIEYMYEKYGKDHVCAVGNINTYQAKGAFLAVAKYYKMDKPDYERCQKLVGKIEERLIKAKSDTKKWVDSFDLLPADEAAYLENMKARFDLVFKYAPRLIGKPSTWSQHAAGYIISPVPLKNVMPTRYSNKTCDIVGQFDKVVSEKLGLLKMDELGLTNLSVITDAARFIKERHDIDLPLYNLSDKDGCPKMWELLATGDTSGLFQISGSSITSVCKQLRPQSISDISTILALHRPATIDAGQLQPYIDKATGRAQVVYHDERLKPILGETFATFVYQEQISQAAIVLAGFTPLEADQLREAIGKKKYKLMEEIKPKFINGCMLNGVAAREATNIWNEIEASGRYGFNKAHSYAYALITFLTLYLKYYYPLEFYCALMRHADFDDVKGYIREARERGYMVTTPSVTAICDGWSILDDKTIVYGVSSISGLGEKDMKIIFENAPYSDFDDFVARAKIQKKTMRLLIKLGFFREWCTNSKDLLERFNRQEMQPNLFGGSMEVRFSEEVENYTKEEIVEMEEEHFGLSITYDSFLLVIQKVQEFANQLMPSQDLDKVPYGGQYNILARWVGKREIVTKEKAEAMAFLRFESDGKEFDVTCFPRMWAKFRQKEEGKWFIIRIEKGDYKDKDSYTLQKYMTVG